MKYGILVWENSFVNIGDTTQIFAIKKLYEKMGISYEDLVKITFDDLKNYKGEKVILPLSLYFNSLLTCFVKKWKTKGIFPISEDIIPVFLSIYCSDENMIQHLLKYEKSFFGCRDFETCRCIQNAVNADGNVFISGCITLTLEKRKITNEQNKTYIIDVPKNFEPLIPIKISKNAIYKTQEYETPEVSADETLKITEQSLEELKDNAKLVITSRLHVALPCIAMGIPVVVVKDYKDDRFSGYDDLVHIYTPEEWENINYEPQIKDIEWLKEEITSNAISLIKSVKDSKNCNEDFMAQLKKKFIKVNDYFINSQSVPYYAGEYVSYLSQQRKFDFFLNKAKYNNIFEYVLNKDTKKMTLVIFGAGGEGFHMIARYKKVINNFEKCFFVDSNANPKMKKQIEYNGFDICTPDVISTIKKDSIAIIIAINKYYSKEACEIAGKLESFGFNEGKEYFHLQKLDNSARLAIDDIALSKK